MYVYLFAYNYIYLYLHASARCVQHNYSVFTPRKVVYTIFSCHSYNIVPSNFYAEGYNTTSTTLLCNITAEYTSLQLINQVLMYKCSLILQVIGMVYFLGLFFTPITKGLGKNMI